MNFVKALNDARTQYDAGKIDEQAFGAMVNAVLNNVIGLTSDADKIKAFDSIAETVLGFYEVRPDDMEDGILGIKSDSDSYVAEAAIAGVFGSDKIFDFIGKTYENG
jgi:hypothetical protein